MPDTWWQESEWANHSSFQPDKRDRAAQKRSPGEAAARMQSRGWTQPVAGGPACLVSERCPGSPFSSLGHSFLCVKECGNSPTCISGHAGHGRSGCVDTGHGSFTQHLLTCAHTCAPAPPTALLSGWGAGPRHAGLEEAAFLPRTILLVPQAGREHSLVQAWSCADGVRGEKGRLEGFSFPPEPSNLVGGL